MSNPLGAAVVAAGVNFSLFSRCAASVELLFFDRVDDTLPSRIIELDPRAHRTCHYWHVSVPGLKAGQLYGYRVHGPADPAIGLRFDSTKVLLDPYGRGLMVPPNYSRQAAARPGEKNVAAMKSVVTDPSAYDWEDDVTPPPSGVADDHLRNARERLHPPS
jgi:isoamylase